MSNMKTSFLAIGASLLHLYRTPICSSFCLQYCHQRSLRTPLHLSSINVNVYDNIFDDNACESLHELALDHSERCHSGSIFIRSPDQKDRLTPLEKAMDTVLNALNDTSPIVEYWSRSSYINMDAHADIDENALKQDGVLKCPRNGHVLYLQVHNSGKDVSGADKDGEKRMGPTVVFPKRKVAWGSVTQIPSLNGEEEYVVDVENYWDDDEKQQHGWIEIDNEETEEMVIVPAVTGRLLRFDGRAFHSVPKPPERYLMSAKELKQYLKAEEEHCKDDDYWDDDFEEEETDLENIRSVLLFNTWPEGSSGPRGVLQDKVTLDVPDGIEIGGGVDEGYLKQLEEERHEDWQDEYGDDFEDVWCNDIGKWDCVAIDMVDNDTTGTFTVPLMGNPSRRGCNIKQDALHGASEAMKLKFYDKERVTSVELKQC